MSDKALQIMNDFVNGKQAFDSPSICPRGVDIWRNEADSATDMFDRVVKPAATITVDDKKATISKGAIKTA
jgi:hypothetical protein